MQCCVESLLGISEAELVKLPWEQRRCFIVKTVAAAAAAAVEPPKTCQSARDAETSGGANGGSIGDDPHRSIDICFPPQDESLSFLLDHDPNHGDQFTFVNRHTGAIFPIGVFATPTIASLRRVVGPEPVRRGSSPPRSAAPPPLLTQAGVDVAALQSTLTTRSAAMIQVASNFNCLENASQSVLPDWGGLVDTAAVDCTQGPAAVFPSLPAYLHRAHFFHGGQTSTQQINLLCNVGRFFGTPSVGKLVLGGGEEALPPGGAAAIDEEVVGQVCMGLHVDCPIVFTRSDDGAVEAVQVQRQCAEGGPGPTTAAGTCRTGSYERVDHCITAAFNFNSFGTPSQALLDAHGGSRLQAALSLARPLLRAAYEGAYLAAIARRRKELYLTLVGGGCFGNPIPLIVEEITRAHNVWSGHASSKLEKVVICLYSERDRAHVEKAMASFPPR